MHWVDWEFWSEIEGFMVYRPEIAGARDRCDVSVDKDLAYGYGADDKCMPQLNCLEICCLLHRSVEALGR
jgi:hypothetical protein